MIDLSAQAAVVHGSGFEVVDGNQILSEGSQANAERALELVRTGAVRNIICCGRGPLVGVEYPLTEAGLMADYLVDNGVSSRFIETEETSTSTVGNWANAAPIILGLEVETVLGVTAKTNIGRMSMIGGFVAAKTPFELVGYSPSGLRGGMKDIAREAYMRRQTRKFLHAHADTPVSELAEAYDEFKRGSLIAKAKQLSHMRSTKQITG